VVGQASAEKSDQQIYFNSKPNNVMTKRILLLAAVLGFIAQSSVFAADASPSPAATAPAKKTTTHHHKHHKKAAEEAPSPASTAKP
jgi:hypothetical protein